jgi:cytochrome P450 family 4 subfamily V
VLLLPYLIHRDPRYWENPEDFLPERFVDMEMQSTELANSLQSRIGRIVAKKAYFPFSSGPRNCVGRMLALMEVRCFSSEKTIACNQNHKLTSTKIDARRARQAPTKV